MSEFTYASLFSGIGGFEQALNKIGGRCVFASEIDKFAAQAYEILYGHKPTGDITQIGAKDVPDHDLLVGGFPCQAFSVAGKRKGFEDTRGTLFFDIARIAKEKQPKALLLENVKGLVNHDKGRTLDTIVKTLNDIGYRVDFEVLNSKYFGVPQNRERIFIVGIREDLVENEPWHNTKGSLVVPKGKRRISKYDDVKTFNFDWPEHGEVTTRLRDILQTKVDEKYYLSEDKTSQLIKQLEGISPTLSATEYKQPTQLLDVKGCSTRTRAYAGQPEQLEVRKDQVSNTVTSVTKDAMALELPQYRIRKLTPLECWRLQGFPDEAHEVVKAAGISDSQRYKQAGNAVTVNVIEAIGERLIPIIVDA